MIRVAVTTRTTLARIANAQVIVEVEEHTMLTLAAARPQEVGTFSVTSDNSTYKADSTSLRVDAAA